MKIINRRIIIRFLAATTGILISQVVCAQVPFDDYFSYTVGSNLGNDGSWATKETSTVIASGSLDGTGLGLAASTGNQVAVTGGTAGINGGSKNDFVGSSGSDINTTYFSFLLQLRDTTGIDTTGAGTPIVNLNDKGSGSHTSIAILLYNNSGNVEVGVAKYEGSTTLASSAFTTTGAGSAIQDGRVYLIVGKYTLNSGSANDTVSLWVNPASLGGSDDPNPTVNAIGAGTADSTHGIGRIYVDQGYDANLDELRISTDWQDVTPTIVCTGAGIGSGATPATQTVNVGSTASLSVSATGNAPTYQWQISTDGGGTFNNVSTGAGGTTANYTTGPVGLSDNGDEFQCIARVACNNSSATSSVATVSVINTSIFSFQAI